MVFSYKYHNSVASKQGIIGLLSQKNTRRYYISQCFEDLRHARIPISCNMLFVEEKDPVKVDSFLVAM